MSKLHVAIPARGQDRLTKLAAKSVELSLLGVNGWRLHVVPGEFGAWGSDDVGRKLDWVLARLPDDCQWFFTMHNDAVVFPGWFQHLSALADEWQVPAVGFFETSEGWPHPAGALYRVEWLRETGASFKPEPGLDCGEAMWEGYGGRHPWIMYHEVRKPWWLGAGSVVVNQYRHVHNGVNWGKGENVRGRVIYAHLGGGTAGARAWRTPLWLWRLMMARAIKQNIPDVTAYWWHPWWEA